MPVSPTGERPSGLTCKYPEPETGHTTHVGKSYGEPSMRSTLTARSITLILIALISHSLIQASTVIIPSDEELVIGSRAIVRGKVLHTFSGYDLQRQAIFTYTTLRLSRVLKGEDLLNPTGEIVIKEPGGITGNLGSDIFGVPKFTAGEDVLLYLDTWPDGSLRVYQWFLGKFRISTNPLTGRESISRESAESGVSIRGRSTMGASTDQSDLNTYLARLTTLVQNLTAQSASHVQTYFADTALSRVPSEFARMEADFRSPNFTIINSYQPQRWFEPDNGLPVTFRINPLQMPNTRLPEDVQAAMDVWSNISNSSLRLRLGETTTTCGLSSIDGVNTISFNNCDGYSSFSPPVRGGCAGVIAAASISNFDVTQRKTVGGIAFYRAIEGNISFNPFATCFFNESCNIREITTHELGHAIGLGHSRDSDASLFAYAHFDGRCGSVRADDEAGARFLYPQVTQVRLPAITTSSIPTVQAESLYDFDLSASGGAPPYRWQVVAGTLPNGVLLLSTGSIRGTPLIAGESVFTVQVTDSVNQSVQRQFVFKVTPNSTVPIPTPVTTPSPTLFFPLDTQVRWFDSRSTAGACSSSRAPLNVVSPLRVKLTGSCLRANIPASANAVVGQITVINLTQSPGNYQIVSAGSPPSSAGLLSYGPLQTLTTTFISPLGIDGSVDIYSGNQIHVIIDITGYFGPPGVGGLYFHALRSPLRITDTSGESATCRLLRQPLGIGSTHIEKATVNCEGVVIPSSARFIIGNATMTNLTSFNGFATFYPARGARPGTFGLQLQPFSTASNQIVVGLDQNGLFNTYPSTGAHLTFDVMGYFSPDSSGLRYYPLNRALRLLETRLNESGCFTLSRPVNANQEVLIPARANCSGIELSRSAAAVTGNTTVYNQSQMNGNLVFFPDDQIRPATSNLHYLVNRLTSNSFTVRLGELGSFKAESGHSINLSIDVNGFFAPCDPTKETNCK